MAPIKARSFGDIVNKFASPNPNFRYAGNLAVIVELLADYLLGVYRGYPMFPMTLFGLPGGGKSSLLFAAIDKVVTHCPELKDNGTAITMNCSSLVFQFPEERDIVQHMQSQLGPYLSRRQGYVVVGADETDALAATRRPLVNFVLTHAVLGILENQTQTLSWIVTTNYPELLDPAVLSRAPTMLYVPTPDVVAVRAILDRWLNPATAEDVAEELFKNQSNSAITLRGLIAGMNWFTFKQYISDREFSTMDAATAARYIVACGGGAFFSNDDLNAYINDHRNAIANSNALIKMTQRVDEGGNEC